MLQAWFTVEAQRFLSCGSPIISVSRVFKSLGALPLDDSPTFSPACMKWTQILLGKDARGNCAFACQSAPLRAMACECPYDPTHEALPTDCADLRVSLGSPD